MNATKGIMKARGRGWKVNRRKRHRNCHGRCRHWPTQPLDNIDRCRPDRELVSSERRISRRQRRNADGALAGAVSEQAYHHQRWRKLVLNHPEKRKRAEKSRSTPPADTSRQPNRSVKNPMSGYTHIIPTPMGAASSLPWLEIFRSPQSGKWEQEIVRHMPSHWREIGL